MPTPDRMSKPVDMLGGLVTPQQLQKFLEEKAEIANEREAQCTLMCLQVISELDGK